MPHKNRERRKFIVRVGSILRGETSNFDSIDRIKEDIIFLEKRIAEVKNILKKPFVYNDSGLQFIKKNHSWKKKRILMGKTPNCDGSD